MRTVVAWGLLLGSLSAQALEERWSVGTDVGSRALPSVVDFDGDGAPEVVVPTRFDGTIWVIESDGAVAPALRYDHWLEGSLAATTPPSSSVPVFVFQSPEGHASLLNADRALVSSRTLPGQPRLGTHPCFTDLDGDGAYEILVARRDGTVTALSEQMVPLWTFDAGAPIDASPAGGPVFVGQGGAFVLTAAGRLHGLTGHGRPLWHFDMSHKAAQFPSFSDVLVLQLAYTHASVLVSDAEGWLYAVDAVEGEEQWRVRVGRSALGTPAVFDVHPNAGRELVCVGEDGAVAVIDATGRVLSDGALPPGRYVPRPVVADVDGDGTAEIVVAAYDWGLVVASLDGTVKQEMSLQGNAVEGVVLADLDGDDRLELLAATDCARVHCFTTAARTGWTHPRAGVSLEGCVRPVAAMPLPDADRTSRSASPDLAILPDFTEESPFATAWVHFGSRTRANRASVVIRQGEILLGSCTQPLRNGGVTVPFVRYNADGITLDFSLYDDDGGLVGSTENYSVRSPAVRPVQLTPPEPFFIALAERAAAYRLPAEWALPEVGGRDTWHVARYMPEAWNRYGLADRPFIDEAIPRLATSARRGDVFGPKHRAWADLKGDTKPFFIMNDYFRPEAPYPADAVRAIEAMAGDRFLGFPVHEWAYRVWKERWEGGQPPPQSPGDAMALLEREFEELLEDCHGRMYAGEGYCLFPHQAFRWGAPMAYAEIGENIPCAPLQFAFLRGAARQYGGRPWGAYLSNWFRGAVADTRYTPPGPRVRWEKPDIATGPNCGHSPSLERRLAMAAHLAGATFVHHESDGHNGSIFVREPEPGRFEISPFGEAIESWYNHAREYPDRGVPYAPVAFLMDSDHGWRPREDRFGLWPKERPERALESLFAHVYPYGGRLDFERGYLCNGPYGDIFDVITDDAPLEVLRNYAVVWPLGRFRPSSDQVRTFMRYVREGGVLVLDSASAEPFPTNFLGARLRDRYSYGVQIQTAISIVPPIGAPFRYQPMWVSRGSEVLAHADDGSPLMVWRREGRGLVILSATHHWADENDNMLPLVPVMLRALTTPFMPVWWEGDVEVLINRTRQGWLIGLINNKGVRKVPTLPASIDNTVEECRIRFRGRTPLRFVNRMGDSLWNSRTDALHVRVPAGEVAVIEAVFGPS